MDRRLWKLAQRGAVVCFVISFCLAFIGCASRVDLRDTPIDPVDYKPVQPEIWTLRNGISVYYIEDSELPLVSGKLYMPGGELWREEGPPGVVGVMGSQLRSGGAGALTPAQLDFELERLSASIGSSFGSEYGAVSFHCLSSDLDRVFGLFSDVVLRPRFDNERLELWRASALEDVKRRKDDPEEVAGVSLQQLLYEGTPYGRVIESRDIHQVARLDLLKAHRRFVRPNDAIFVVSGDVPREKLAKLVKKHLGRWERRQEEFGSPPPVPNKPKPGIYFVKKPVSQSSILAGQLSVPRHTPDQYAISVFNSVYGTSGFDSRLMKRIRSDLGLVYGIYGATSAGVVRGRNVISMQTKAETTVEALVESLNELRKLQQEPPTSKELDVVRQSMQSSFVFRFDSPSKVADRRALLKIFDYPKDYDDAYLERIFSVGKPELLEVAQNRWRLDDFVVVVVGNQTAYNLLKSALKSPPDVLRGYALIDGTFDEKFALGAS